MTSEQIQWLVGGVLAGLLLALPLCLWRLRVARAAARTDGAASREPELVALSRDLVALQRERDALRERGLQLDAELATLRERLDRLSDERAALAARAERSDSLDRQLATVRGELDQTRGARTQAEARVAEQAARLAEQQRAAGVQAARADGLERQIVALRTELDQARTTLAESEARVAEQAARLEEQQRAAEARYRELERAREQMKTEFQALASAILEDKSKRFGEAQQVGLDQVLKPLREQLGDFRRAVSDAYEKENNARVALQTRIDDLVRLNQTLGQEAQTLSRALSSDNRSQGYWGELKLERLLESAGLEKGQQYLTQESFRDLGGDRYRPDAVLRLPEGRDIVIDAKMVLVDYQRACDEADDGARDAHLARHAAALRNHVRQLGEKDYSRLEGINAPDLVMLFVPVEGAFLEALRRDSALYGYAFERKIILVGPGNLLASLRLVAQLWRTEQQNRNAKKIADRAAAMYDKFVGFLDDMQRVGEALERARAAHSAAIGKLSQGRGNLVRRADELRQLGVAPTKKLPAALQDMSSAEDDELQVDANADAGASAGADGDADRTIEGTRNAQGTLGLTADPEST